MIVVVADTSPLNYLVQINCERILPTLYELASPFGALSSLIEHGTRSITPQSTAVLSTTLSVVRMLFTVFGARSVSAPSTAARPRS